MSLLPFDETARGMRKERLRSAACLCRSGLVQTGRGGGEEPMTRRLVCNRARGHDEAHARYAPDGRLLGTWDGPEGIVRRGR